MAKSKIGKQMSKMMAVPESLHVARKSIDSEFENGHISSKEYNKRLSRVEKDHAPKKLSKRNDWGKNKSKDKLKKHYGKGDAAVSKWDKEKNMVGPKVKWDAEETGIGTHIREKMIKDKKGKK